PAVVVPSGSKTGFSFARASIEVSRRGPSSATTSPTGTISRSKKPSSWARTARSCERSAQRSCSSREIPSSRETNDACSTMRPPPSFPNGVRTAETITDLAIRSSLAIDDEALQRPEQAPRAPRDRRQPDEPVRERLAAVAPGNLPFGSREPVLVDELDRVAIADGLDWHLEMLRPAALARGARKRGLAADEVHLGVVEERVLVEVGGADRQPAGVDDPDLRVDVDRLPRGAVSGVQGAGEESAGAGVGHFEPADLAAGVLVAAVGMRRKNRDDAEVVSRGPAQLLGQDLDELRRPEELALQVDEPLGRPERANVTLEDAEAPAASALVDVLRDGRR